MFSTYDHTLFYTRDIYVHIMCVCSHNQQRICWLNTIGQTYSTTFSCRRTRCRSIVHLMCSSREAARQTLVSEVGRIHWLVPCRHSPGERTHWLWTRPQIRETSPWSHPWVVHLYTQLLYYKSISEQRTCTCTVADQACLQLNVIIISCVLS